MGTQGSGVSSNIHIGSGGFKETLGNIREREEEGSLVTRRKTVIPYQKRP